MTHQVADCNQFFDLLIRISSNTILSSQNKNHISKKPVGPPEIINYKIEWTAGEFFGFLDLIAKK